MKKTLLVYPLTAEVLHYSQNANAYQKLALVADFENGYIVVPRGYRGFARREFGAKVVEVGDIPSGGHDVVVCLSVSNEMTMLCALARHFLRHTRYVAFCWDPPGVSRRDGKRAIDRLRCWLMDGLMGLVARHSECFVLNLHPGFLENRFSSEALRKIHVFPNGTLVASNQAFANDVRRHPKRISVSSQFESAKGCWDIVTLIKELWSLDEEIEFLWIGDGTHFESVRSRLRELGCKGSRILLPGKIALSESMRLQGSCQLAVCLYKDVPSLRWNYVLKAPEALSLGLPVVAYDLPGIGEYVENEKTGHLFRKTDLGVLARYVVELLNDGTRLARMRANCLQKALKYDWLRIHESIRRTILSCIEK